MKVFWICAILMCYYSQANCLILFNDNNTITNHIYYDEDFAKNILFVEAAGNGFIFSVNYERMLQKNISLRIGYGGRVYPAMISFYGNGTNKLEAGIGVTYIAEEIQFFDNKKTILIASSLGLRHQKESGGLVIRLLFTPFYNPNSEKILFWGGVSVGWAF